MSNPKGPSSRDLNWGAMVRKAWGQEWSIPEWCYDFGNGRKFKSTDRSNSGIYGITAVNALLVEPVNHPDMHIPELLTEAGGALRQE